MSNTDQEKELSLWGFSSVLTRNIVVGVMLLLVSLLLFTVREMNDAQQRERECRQELSAKVEQLLREQIAAQKDLEILEQTADSLRTNPAIKRKRR